MGKRKKKNKKLNAKYIILASIAILILLICIGAGVSNVNEAGEAVAETIASLGNSIARDPEGRRRSYK